MIRPWLAALSLPLMLAGIGAMPWAADRLPLTMESGSTSDS